MSQHSETPFDNIESSHEYVTLLAEAIALALSEVESDIALARPDIGERRKEALRLVAFKLHKLSSHMTASRRILNDLRSLRRLLFEERSLPNTSGGAIIDQQMIDHPAPHERYFVAATK
jgi:hypothetical protein